MSNWRFPYGGEHLSSVEIWSQGGIYPSEKSPDPVVSLVTQLSLKPAETEVFCGRTTNNSYRIEWRNAHPNRNDGQIADAAIELRRNGDCIVTENGVTTVVPYDVPFAHDGFGQDADWVRANFTNAEEILAAGYRNWAEDQIGYDQLNGLYLFTAYFAEDPPEATELYVGDYTVAETNAGEYVFVLEKGTEYEFGTWPDDVEADYWAQDDMKAVYAKQTAEANKKCESNCPLYAIGHTTNSSRIYRFDEMDAGHVTPWSKGGATGIKNCQMLCKTHNRAKGNQ